MITDIIEKLNYFRLNKYFLAGIKIAEKLIEFILEEKGF